MRIAVLTTSYPRFPEDAAGRFVGDAVQHLRGRGVEVEVVGPEQFRHFGIAYGHGIVGNLRRRPWLALLVPALLASLVRAARRVEADLRTRGGRRLSVAPRGLRRRVPRGDGSRAARRGDRCRWPAGPRRRRGDGPGRLARGLHRAARCAPASAGRPGAAPPSGAAGRERARARFSWSAATDDMLPVYSEAAGRMPG